MTEDEEKSNTLIGTKTYMAPEIIYRKAYNAKKADIFSLGVIFFTFYFGKPPFNDARLDDVYYKTFLHNPKKFWDFHIKNSNVFCEEKFIVMISKMLALNYENRFTVDEVMNCEWMKEPVDILEAKKYINIYFGNMKSTVKRSQVEINYDREEKSSGNNFLEGDDEIVFWNIRDGSFRPHVILSLKNKEKVVDKIMDVFYCIKDEFNGDIIWNEEKTKFSFKFLNVRNNVVFIKVKLYVIGKDFGVDFLRKEGRAFGYYEIKKKIIDCLQE